MKNIGSSLLDLDCRNEIILSAKSQPFNCAFSLKDLAKLQSFSIDTDLNNFSFFYSNSNKTNESLALFTSKIDTANIELFRKSLSGNEISGFRIKPSKIVTLELLTNNLNQPSLNISVHNAHKIRDYILRYSFMNINSFSLSLQKQNFPLSAILSRNNKKYQLSVKSDNFLSNIKFEISKNNINLKSLYCALEMKNLQMKDSLEYKQHLLELRSKVNYQNYTFATSAVIDFNNNENTPQFRLSAGIKEKLSQFNTIKIYGSTDRTVLGAYSCKLNYSTDALIGIKYSPKSNFGYCLYFNIK